MYQNYDGYYLERQPRHGCCLSLLLQDLRFEFEWHQDDVEMERVLIRGDIKVTIIFSSEKRGFPCVDSVKIDREGRSVSLNWEGGLNRISYYQLEKQLRFWINEPIVEPQVQ